MLSYHAEFGRSALNDVRINLFVCPHPFVFPWAGFGARVTTLNEPRRAFATSTIAWVRS